MPKTLGPSKTPQSSSRTSGDKDKRSSSLATNSGMARTRLICTRKRVRAGPSMKTFNYINRYPGAFETRSKCAKFDAYVQSTPALVIQDREAAIPAHLRQICE